MKKKEKERKFSQFKKSLTASAGTFIDIKNKKILWHVLTSLTQF